MLDNFRETAITWDKANRKVYEPLRVSSGDNKGRKLSVQVVNGGVVESLFGASLSLFWETKDKAHKGLDAFTAVDATKGEFEIYYTTGMLSNEGTLNANLVLVDTSGRVVSEPFTITVFKGIDDDAIQSDDSFTALTEALAQVGNINNKADRSELLALESTFEQNKLSVEQQLQHINQQKADVSYVDQTISTMTNGAIKGTYTTLSSLESAYPQGAVGPFLVEETQLRYIWDVNKMEWVSIGVYEPAEIADGSIVNKKYANGSVSVEKTNFIELATTNLINPNLFKGYLISSSTGQLSPNSNRSSSDYIFAVTDNDFYLTASKKTSIYDALSVIFIYNHDNGYVGSTSGLSTSDYFTVVQIHANCYKYTPKSDFKFRLVSKSYFGIDDICINATGDYQPYLNKLNDRLFAKNETVDNQLKPMDNLLDESLSVVGYLEYNNTVNTSGAAADSYLTTPPIAIEKNKTIGINVPIRKLIYLNEFEETIYPDGFVDDVVESYEGVSARATYVRFSYNTQYYGQVVIAKTPLPTTYRPYQLTNPYLFLENVENNLIGETMVAFGDSLIAGNEKNNISFVTTIANKNGMSLYNYAKGGATISQIDDRLWIGDQIQTAIDDNVDPKYGVFDGLTNDAIGGRTSSGVITEGYDGPFDVTTVAGGAEFIIHKIRNTWPDIKLIYVRPHNMSSRGDLQKIYGDLLEQVCEKWSIDVVNIYKSGGLNTNIDIMKTLYTVDSDGTHPNALGESLFYIPAVENKLKM